MSGALFTVAALSTTAIAAANMSLSDTRSALQKPGLNPRLAVLATAMTMLWLRRSMAFTRPR